ncbi:MAG TPA: TIGR03557 family F420-dependent LLM class oxidoreductase [Methylomirabilota bacterium]|nr:TIGR03557 family F420-dependent LLM class oxidoreductase [Methylomirabilota bacterium]
MTPSLGYKLSSEEQSPVDLVRHAQMAEDAGFDFALISDHYHPWTDRQGQSPFVWSVLGAIAQATRRLVVGTAVTCPTMRIHPAVVAQAAATTAALMPGRFFLGVGTGENLNEHIVGDRWPETEVRQERLTEAIEVIRLLWQGGNRSYHGRYFTVENARLYTLPDSPPPLLVAVGGRRGAEQAGQLGDGMIGTELERVLLTAFDEAGGAGKPRYGEITVCWAKDEAAARRIAHEHWPTSGMESSLSWELPLPAHFEAVAKLVTEDEIAESITCGPDSAKHLAAIRAYAEAGYDHICVHQVGKDQKGFFEFYEQEILPQLRAPARRRRAAARRRRAR